MKLSDLRRRAASLARQVLETPLYEAGIRAYSLAATIAALKNPKIRKMTAGHRAVWDTLREKIDPAAEYVWVHAASLGEFEQGRPLMEEIKRRSPEQKILLTFFSPSGYEVRKNYARADCVVYLPFDTAANARRLLKCVRVSKAYFVKYEIWRNYLRELHRLVVPTYLISAIFRPEQAFFRKRSAWYRQWLSYFTHIYVQNEESRKLLASAGITNVTVAGDTRFDRVTDIRRAAKEIPEVEKFLEGASLRFIAGSSWPLDEEVYAPWLVAHPEVKWVVAPHEFDPRRLEAMKRRFGGKAVLLSELREDPRRGEGMHVLIIDCFGLLSSIYAYGDVAYVGGAFGSGLHNINEAAVYGIPVVFGPKYGKFMEAVDLTTLGGAVSVKGREGFEHFADRMLYDPEERKKRGRWAGEYIASKIGATEKILYHG